jgi:HPt (histidine-containing phosphotransfer) domain-containing protein
MMLEPKQSAAYAELCELIGTEAAAAGLTRLRQLIQELLASSPANYPELAKHAHAMVGHAALLGFSELSSSCKELEQASKSGRHVSIALEGAKQQGHAALRAIALLDENGSLSI